MFLKINKHLKKSIEFRIAVWYSAVFIIWSLLLYFIISSLIYSAIRDKDRLFISEELQEFVNIANTESIDHLLADIQNEIAAFRKMGVFLLLTTPNGGVHFSLIPEEWQSYKPESLLQDLLVKEETWKVIRGKKWFKDEEEADLDDTIDVTSQMLNDGSILYLGHSSNEVDEIIMHFGKIFLILLIAVFIFGISGGAFLAWWILRPLKELIRTVNKVETGNMDARVPSRNTGDTLDELATMFNRMLEKIELLIRGMKEALDNVAHDLKTPMMRMRVSIEKNIIADSDRETLHEALMDCAEESERVVNMLNTLMDISEAETGTLTLHMETLSLFTLVEKICDLYHYPAEDKKIALSMSVDKNLMVQADPNRLYQVLANLVDNAVKYSPVNGSVLIAAGRQGAGVKIWVEDTGSGISDEDISRVFERLYRGDKSRSQRGLGLGLALVKAVVNAHNGEINVENLPDKGACFTILLP